MALKPARVVPSHGSIGDATMIARDRAFLQAVQARVSELKRAGKTLDEAVAAIGAEIAPSYPEWGNPAGAAAVVRAAFAEARHGLKVMFRIRNQEEQTEDKP